MTYLTINDITITQLLQEKYAKLGHGWITLMQLPIERSMEVNIEAMRALQSLGYEGIFITLSKDYTELAKTFREKDINIEKLFFIDGISQMYGIEQVNSPNVLYVAGPVSIDAHLLF